MFDFKGILRIVNRKKEKYFLRKGGEGGGGGVKDWRLGDLIQRRKKGKASICWHFWFFQSMDLS